MKKREVLTLKKEDVSNINDKEISRLLSDKDFMNMLHITPEDVKKQIEISKKQFEEISDYVANYKGTFAELYKELGGWNLGYANPEQDENNLFDCYYKSLLITVWVDEGVLKVSPHDVYIYAEDITDVDTDEILHLDFDKPIDFSKLKVTEGRKSLGHSISKKQESKKLEDKECLKEETLTWEDIMTNAEGTTFGQQSLKVKDTAMDNIEQLLVKAGIDIDNVENVEDEIEKYCKDNNIKFDTHGNIITECDKVTEDVVSFDEAFYEKICRAYIDTMNLEWVTTNPENYDSVVHGYFANDDVAEKWEYGAKVTPENFKDAIYDGYTQEEAEELDVDWYEYDTWLDFYEDYVEDKILYDIDDIGVYSGGTTYFPANGSHWDFYISKEDLIKLGLWDEDIKSEFLDEGKKVTENISFDNIMDYRELIDGDNGDLVDTFFFDHKLTEEEDKAIIEAINKAKSDVEDYDNYTVMEYINQIVPIKQSLSAIYADLGPSSKKQIKY